MCLRHLVRRERGTGLSISLSTMRYAFSSRATRSLICAVDWDFFLLRIGCSAVAAVAAVAAITKGLLL